MAYGAVEAHRRRTLNVINLLLESALTTQVTDSGPSGRMV